MSDLQCPATLLLVDAQHGLIEQSRRHAFLATLLRFIPYIGPWIAAAFPVALSFAVFRSPYVFFVTLGLFIVIELISNNVVEPWLYGARTGLSPLAVIVSAVSDLRRLARPEALRHDVRERGRRAERERKGGGAASASSES